MLKTIIEMAKCMQSLLQYNNIGKNYK